MTYLYFIAFLKVWLSGLMPRGIIVHTNSMMLTIWIFNPYGQTLMSDRMERTRQ